LFLIFFESFALKLYLACSYFLPNLSLAFLIKKSEILAGTYTAGQKIQFS